MWFTRGLCDMVGMVAQLFGFLALGAVVLSYQQKNRLALLRLQILANALFALSYFMLGAMSMAVMSIINMARSYVFSKDETNWGKNPAWLYIFLAVPIIGSIIAWEGPLSLLVMSATLLLTVALYSKNLTFMRRMFLVPPLLYFTYNLANRAYGGIGSDLFSFASAAIAIWRFDIRKQKNKEHEEEDETIHHAE